MGLTPLWATAPVPDDHMEVPDRLLRLGDGDTASPELVQGGLRSEQLIDGIRHPLSMIDAGDIQWAPSSNNGVLHAKNGDGGKFSKSPWPLIRRLHDERFGARTDWGCRSLT